MPTPSWGVKRCDSEGTRGASWRSTSPNIRKTRPGNKPQPIKSSLRWWVRALCERGRERLLLSLCVSEMRGRSTRQHQRQALHRTTSRKIKRSPNVALMEAAPTLPERGLGRSTYEHSPVWGKTEGRPETRRASVAPLEKQIRNQIPRQQTHGQWNEPSKRGLLMTHLLPFMAHASQIACAIKLRAKRQSRGDVGLPPLRRRCEPRQGAIGEPWPQQGRHIVGGLSRQVVQTFRQRLQQALELAEPQPLVGEVPANRALGCSVVGYVLPGQGCIRWLTPGTNKRSTRRCNPKQHVSPAPIHRTRAMLPGGTTALSIPPAPGSPARHSVSTHLGATFRGGAHWWRSGLRSTSSRRRSPSDH